MTFNSPEYIAFLMVVFFAFWGLARLHLLRTVMLLAASYLFYAYWNVWYLSLILGTTVTNYFVAVALERGLERDWGAARRKLLVAVAVGVNLAVLGTFKYADFFIDSLVTMAASFGVELGVHTLGVLLPVGISFYTFQGIGYVVDVYRGDVEAERSFLHFALFISFFTQLVAGPIVRARDLLPQLRAEAVPDPSAGQRGVMLIATGLFKKMVLADLLALHLVDRVFDLPNRFGSLEVLAAIYGYGLQIYYDFSGYTDIAIGSALILGFRLPPNFRAPYQATDLQDFWRRWHISLSTWLRDYLYIPLGGSRSRWRPRTYLNLLTTMVLGGLWHGPAWSFVLWGTIHGVGLAAVRFWQRHAGGLVERVFGAPAPDSAWSRARRALAIFVTFHFVTFAWVFFRAENLPSAMAVFDQLFLFLPGSINLTPMVTMLLVAGITLHWFPEDVAARIRARLIGFPAYLQAVLLVGYAWLIANLSSTDTTPFVYFQF